MKIFWVVVLTVLGFVLIAGCNQTNGSIENSQSTSAITEVQETYGSIENSQSTSAITEAQEKKKRRLYLDGLRRQYGINKSILLDDSYYEGFLQRVDGAPRLREAITKVQEADIDIYAAMYFMVDSYMNVFIDVRANDEVIIRFLLGSPEPQPTGKLSF